MSDLKLHIVAPKTFNMKDIIESQTDLPLKVKVIGWDYSFSGLSYWATSEKDEIPDIILMFDSADYPKVDLKNNSNIYYAGMVDCIKEARLKLGENVKYIMVLSSDKEENLEFLNELFKLSIHNIYFVKDKFGISDVRGWLFNPGKKLEDNEKYLLTGSTKSETKVITKVETKYEIKEVEKVVEVDVKILKDKLIGTVFLGVAGANRGIGCTHIAISIARYIAKHKSGFKVAYIELSGKRDIQSLNASCPQAHKEGSFTYDGIDFYSNRTSLLELVSLPDYNYIVMDFGQLKSIDSAGKYNNCEQYHEFVRATLSVLVCGSKPWQIKDIGACLYKDANKTDTSDSLTWKLMFNLCDKDYYKSITKDTEWTSYNFPYNFDVLNQDALANEVLSDLLKDYIPRDEVIKSKRKLFHFLNK